VSEHDEKCACELHELRMQYEAEKLQCEFWQEKLQIKRVQEKKGGKLNMSCGKSSFKPKI
jgi:hypothetical protein